METLIFMNSVSAGVCLVCVFDRYFQLVEQAIETDFIAPLSDEWLTEVYGFIPKHLKTAPLRQCLRNVTQVSKTFTLWFL